MDENDWLNAPYPGFPSEYGELRKTVEPKEALVLEALGHLHKIEVERFYERRTFEWRLAFTL